MFLNVIHTTDMVTMKEMSSLTACKSPLSYVGLSALLVSTLFPIIILMESVVHVVSLLAPLGLDAKTAFLAQFRME